jgi:ParB family chromosome partitioning protein
MELKIIPIDEIQPNPFQPRETFEKESLQELADSIKDVNVIQPIVVRRQGKGYQIVAGERRWRAAQMAGLKEIPSIIKDIPEERVLLESLIENLHRLDLTDSERENTLHELWEKREALGIDNKADLARKIGVREQRVMNDIDAWEFRRKEKVPMGTSTDAIRRTRGLEPEIRKRVIEKLGAEEIKASEIDTVAKVIRKASEPIKREILKSKSLVTPKMAEIIVEKLPSEEEQGLVLEEIKRFRLTEDEVADRVRDIQRAKTIGEPLRKEMEVHEGTVYTVGEYECPHCKRHYWIRCNGKKDWIE